MLGRPLASWGGRGRRLVEGVGGMGGTERLNFLVPATLLGQLDTLLRGCDRGTDIESQRV